MRRLLAAAAMTLAAAAAAGAQGAPRNDLPQPYQTTRDWGSPPPGVKWAAVTAVEPAPDGTIYVIHRCFANSCAGRTEAPILAFDANGRLLRSWGAGMFVFPHGGHVDRDGNLWVTDARGENGTGHQVFKFSPDGRVLMTLGQKGVSGSTAGLFDQPTDVVVAPGGDVFVTDSHRNGKNNRVMRFTRDGTFVKQWGRKGSGRGELSEPHTIAIDSRGRLLVGDRENNRIVIYDQDGTVLDEWRQFGRPSGIAITRDDTIYVADSESGPDTGAHELPGIRKGIRIGSARDGSVTAFIEDMEPATPDHSGAEGVGVDAQGNVYGAVVRRQMLERHVKKAAGRPVVYAALGAELVRFDVNVEEAALTRRDAVRLHANVQEAAVDPSGRFLYVATSNGGASYVAAGAGGGARGTEHRLTAFRIDPATGALQPHGTPATLPSRPIHVTVDPGGAHVLSAFNDPSGVTVHRLRADGAIGEQVAPSGALDLGVYGHQVRVLPSGRGAILVTRGNGPAGTRPEDPGALKVFDFDAGVLKQRASIAPKGGFGFQARHLDFHPSRPWLFLSVERQNELQVFGINGDDLDAAPRFTKSTLADPARAGQTTSAIRVHPNGRTVYVGNRAATSSGDNSIAVFSIDQSTGEPALVQNAATRGIYPRTFAVDDGGRVLVAANQGTGLAVFRIRPDGTLEFSRDYPLDLSTAGSVFWVGMASLK